MSPAAGPLTCNGLPAINPTRIPPMMPVIRPTSAGTPQALAIARHNGRATIKTTNEDGMSLLSTSNHFGGLATREAFGDPMFSGDRELVSESGRSAWTTGVSANGAKALLA